MGFESLKLDPLILKALEEQGYKTTTEIQAQAIGHILKGRDMIGQADTGTGKTAAFALPILQNLAKEEWEEGAFHPVRSLILAPTRELAIQIGESFQTYGKYLSLQVGVVYGGVTPKRHIKVMKREPDILVATPGRLLDLFERACVDLDKVETLVIDEADRMLDLGMAKDVALILSKLPKVRQNLLFSATIPTTVRKLAHSILDKPVEIKVKSKGLKRPSIQQKVYYVDEPDKTALLLEILQDPALKSVLIFTRTKKKADKLCKAINQVHIRAKAIHGDKNQSERMRALTLFKNKEARVLVATDVAARGIDIDQVSHVINMSIPNVAETYIHRIGRTGRAGDSGTALSMCSGQEAQDLKAIEKLQQQAIEVVKDHPYQMMHKVIQENRAKYEDKKTPGQRKKPRSHGKRR